MVDNTSLRAEFGKLIEKLPKVLDTSIADYFSDSRCPLMTEGQSAAVQNCSHMTIHELILCALEDKEMLLGDFQRMSEIKREPINHLSPLYAFYHAIVSGYATS